MIFFFSKVRIEFLPFVWPCDFFFQKNRYSTFSLPCEFFSNLRMEFFCLAVWLFQTNRVLPLALPYMCLFVKSKNQVRIFSFYIKVIFFLNVRIESLRLLYLVLFVFKSKNRFLTFSYHVIFFSKVRIEILPFALPCDFCFQKNRFLTFSLPCNFFHK